MKFLLYLSCAISLLLTSNNSSLIAQEIQGEATYKTSRKMDDLIVNDGQNKEMEDQIRAQLQKQFQKEYTLSFNKEESLYKENESLEAPNPGAASGVVVKISGNSDVLYNNHKEKEYISETEIFGKLFLIKDSLKTKEWELSKESKSIGEYICFKATRSEEYTTITMSDDMKEKEVKKTKIITAWYTPQIPIASGPSEYNGLPGLILEVNDQSETIICSKIVLNPKNGIKIIKPSKGKVVNQEKFDEIQEKKNKEMMEQFHSGRKSDKGHTMTIQIGG